MAISESDQPKLDTSAFDKKVKEYKEARQETANAFLVLFDIIDSTARKRESGCDWYDQTVLVYTIIDCYYKSLKSIKHLTDGQCCLKRLGDGVMVFISVDREHEPNFFKTVLSLAIEVRNKLSDSTKNTFKQPLKLKLVCSYLEDIRHIRSEVGDKILTDVLGRGIDFSFRIEKFSGSTHVVLNKYFANLCLGNDPKSEEVMQKPKLLEWMSGEYWLVPVERTIKGWPGYQLFYILVPKQSLAQRIEEDGNPRRMDSYVAVPELMRVLLDDGTRQVDPVGVDTRPTNKTDNGEGE